MNGGQLLVFWCTAGGLAVAALTEAFRWRHRGPTLGRSSHDRLMHEIRRHQDDR